LSYCTDSIDPTQMVMLIWKMHFEGKSIKPVTSPGICTNTVYQELFTPGQVVKH